MTPWEPSPSSTLSITKEDSEAQSDQIVVVTPWTPAKNFEFQKSSLCVFSPGGSCPCGAGRRDLIAQRAQAIHPQSQISGRRRQNPAVGGGILLRVYAECGCGCVLPAPPPPCPTPFHPALPKRDFPGAWEEEGGGGVSPKPGTRGSHARGRKADPSPCSS